VSARPECLVAVAALSTALWFGGCESQPLIPEDNVRLTVFVSHTELVVPRDTLLVRVVATNTSRWPFTLEPWGCSNYFRIRNDANEVVPLMPHACLLGRRSTISLPPGKSVELLNVWAGEVASESLPRRPVLMPPGEYQLEASIGNGEFSLVSAPVTIRVRAPE
jgi:hypothetical protein